MRFWSAVALGAFAVAIGLARADLAQPASVLVVAYLALAAFATGFFAARLGLVAGALALYAGLAVWLAALGLREALDRSGWYGDGVGALGYVYYFGVLGTALAPSALACALAGWSGVALRHRIMRRRA